MDTHLNHKLYRNILPTTKHNSEIKRKKSKEIMLVA